VNDARMDTRFSRGVFALSRNGVLACMTGSNQTRTQLRWVDRAGKSLGDVGEPADYTYGGTPRISPDGKSSVMPIANRDRGVSDVWIVDLESGRKRKLTVDTEDHASADWLPGGRSVVAATGGTGDAGLDAVDLGGTQKRIFTGHDFLWPETAMGDRLLYSTEAADQSDIIQVSISTGESVPLLATPADESGSQFSPDGRFVAYMSDETGRSEVSVMAYPQPGGRWQVSQGGGREPRWNRNGRELFYVDGQNYIVSVDVELGAGTFHAGTARPLFQWHGSAGQWRYDVAPDGTRFLVAAALEADLASPVTIITDWTRKVRDR